MTDETVFEIYMVGYSTQGEWRWELIDDGEVIADSGRGYPSKEDAMENIERVKDAIPDSDINVVETD